MPLLLCLGCCSPQMARVVACLALLSSASAFVPASVPRSAKVAPAEAAIDEYLGADSTFSFCFSVGENEERVRGRDTVMCVGRNSPRFCWLMRSRGTGYVSILLARVEMRPCLLGENKRAGRTHRRADREPYRCSLLMWRVWRVGARFCPPCPVPSRSHRPPARGDPHWLATRAIVALPSVETAGLWDPWGFSKNEEKLYRYRCVEIKHGRVAMLAVTGCVRRGGKRARHDSPRGGGAARRRNLRALWR